MTESVVDKMLDPAVSWVLIALCAIVVGGIVTIVKAVIRHRERMALIDAGLHPDPRKARAADAERAGV